MIMIVIFLAAVYALWGRKSAAIMALITAAIYAVAHWPR